jgi:Glyoxalase-like domain
MGLSVHAVTINALDPASLAGFWAAALGGDVTDSGNGYVLVESESGAFPRLLFAPVDEHAHRPGRIHLDLSAEDKSQETRRLVALGARVVAERSDSNFRWTVLTDPEGNPFCV